MKLKLLLCCALCVLLFPICGYARIKKQTSRAVEITETEYQYLVRYGQVRKKVMDFCHLPQSATAEDVRPHIAKLLKFPKTASWEEMLHAPLIRRFCTEKRREKFVAIFRLKPDAMWVELGLRVEELWERLH